MVKEGGRGSETCIKYLKKEWNGKKSGGTKTLKRRGMLGRGMSALKKGTGTLMNYELFQPDLAWVYY